MPAAELAQMRQNLATIRNQLAGGLDVADPQRVRVVLNGVEQLIAYIDDYPQTP